MSAGTCGESEGVSSVDRVRGHNWHAAMQDDAGAWVLHVPVYDQLTRESTMYEEFHRRLRYGFETVETAPGLEVWRHRDPVEAIADDATLCQLTPERTSRTTPR